MIDRFPEPKPLPRQYRLITPTPRDTTPETWKSEALCAQIGGDGWFPDKNERQVMTPQDAKRVCAACPVANQCLQYALDNEEAFGIWGGLSTKERRKLRTPKQVGHGTNAMYNRGCHDPDQCPRNEKGTSCSTAHRNYQRRWDQVHKAGAA